MASHAGRELRPRVPEVRTMPDPASSDLNPPAPSGAKNDAPDAPEPATASLVRSEELLKGEREILIAHCQDVYRLRVTRNGKLILTK
jgi:hemin uptake protein HemP